MQEKDTDAESKRNNEDSTIQALLQSPKDLKAIHNDNSNNNPFMQHENKTENHNQHTQCNTNDVTPTTADKRKINIVTEQNSS